MHPVALLSRAPARIMEAETHQDLLGILSGTLRCLYRNLRRHELHVADGNGRLVPAGRPAGGTGLLASLLSRLQGSEDRCLAAAHLFPAPRDRRRGSLMSAPLLDAQAPAGLIVLEAEPGTDNFTRLDLHILEGVAGMLQLARQRLRSKQAERTRSAADLDRQSARMVQHRLMNGSLPAGSGVRVDARYLPALDVGGDFYELACLGDGKIAAAIGDVCGKGVSAALVMARVSSDVRRALRSGAGPAQVLRCVNDMLLEEESETFVTASSIQLDASGRRLTVASAGHLPLLIRRATGDTFAFGLPSGTPLGMMPSDYADEDIDLAPEDVVLLMTDGVAEHLGQPADCMGLEFLCGLLRRAPPDPKVINRLVLEAVARGGGAKPLDDVTLVALQLEAR